jgi:hypothetical protein
LILHLSSERKKEEKANETFAVFGERWRREHVVDSVGGRDLLLLQVQVLIDVPAKLALPLLSFLRFAIV